MLAGLHLLLVAPAVGAVRVPPPLRTLPAASPLLRTSPVAVIASSSYPPPQDGDHVDIFCRGANELMEKTNFIPAVRDYVRLSEDAQPLSLTPSLPWESEFPWARLKTPPCSPGLSRPVWLAIAPSVPTPLG